jgi:hypothetical protein
MAPVLRNLSSPCAYCGQYTENLTRDHVVPKAMWGETKLPNSMITAPCCRSCHQYWDHEAEYFRNTLVAQIDRGAHPVSDRVLEGQIVRHLVRSGPARRDFFRNVQQFEIRNRSGLILGYRSGFELDVSRFSRSIEKIVRALFYLKSKFALHSDYQVLVARGNDFWNDAGFQNILAAMESVVGCGDDVFLMRCARDRSDPNITAWLLQFYRQIAVFAWTDNKSSVTEK